MEVDLSGFARAIGRLEEAYAAYTAAPRDQLIRDAVVIRFLFTYEVALAALRRYLEAYSVHWKASAEQTTPGIIRTANQDGLLQGDWELWHTFRDSRNQISHTYNEEKAIALIARVPAFLAEVRFLHNGMESQLR